MSNNNLNNCPLVRLGFLVTVYYFLSAIKHSLAVSFPMLSGIARIFFVTLSSDFKQAKARHIQIKAAQ